MEKVSLVGRNNFVPAPKVDSIVLKFKLNKKYPALINDKEFIKFIRMMFATKRKTILNNLAIIVNNKTLAEDILLKLNYALNLRSENLSLMIFIFYIMKLNKLRENYKNEIRSYGKFNLTLEVFHKHKFKKMHRIKSIIFPYKEELILLSYCLIKVNKQFYLQ
ncbi:rRNA adenine N-6-methyltransferase family protein [Spiroplasma citri]|uniref:rRNA adenine N-6-methyltransferase family protein n=1 Tax=Spiroplasma citri TaxID=2133 RepID=UPI0023B7A301|nr:rRNA adenine N-6-methyltransferase family protein [Spiroplasma citri]